MKVVGVRSDVDAGAQDAVTEQDGTLYLPKTPEQFDYDDDGNLTQDGRWTYTWDAENRLIDMQSISAVPAAGKQQLKFGYDYMGRRFLKQVYAWSATSGTYQLATETHFLYDGWNCIAETGGTNNLVRTYLWGADLSGSLTGAGGVGGLLAITGHSTGANAGDYLTQYDGNGNVIGLINAANGSIAAQYEYGPFGEVVRASGPMAGVNPFQFSTTYTDSETGLNYYGFRYYNASTGRWLSRDPIGEVGGTNLYEFVGNNSVNATDRLGLSSLGSFDVRISTHKYYSDVSIGFVGGNSAPSGKCPCKHPKLSQIVKTEYASAFGSLVHSANWQLDGGDFYPNQTDNYGSATMEDHPGAAAIFPVGSNGIYVPSPFALAGLAQYFETYAICTDDGPGKYWIIGGVSWGHYISATEQFNWGSGSNIVPQSPSSTFRALFPSNLLGN